MEKEKNNLFKYATKELSQDAFICWCINWINYPVNNEIGKKILKVFLPKSLETKIDFDNVKVEIKKQFLNIDILLIINKKYFIIIEDKIDTSEHNVGQTDENQLEFYKKKLIKSLEKPDIKSKFEIENFKEENIYTVYLKTGKLNEQDEKVKVDKKISGIDILDFINNCLEANNINRNELNILREFYIYLNEKIELSDDTRSSRFMKKGRLEIGTRFGKKYQCLNCFAKYFNFLREDITEYNKDYQYTFRGARVLDKISSKKICVWLPKYYNSDGWINKVNDEENIIEEYKISNGKREKVNFGTEKHMYRYVFVRKNDIYNNEIFEFSGLYYLDTNYKDEYKRIWKRYNSQNAMVSINAEKMEKELEHCIIV